MRLATLISTVVLSASAAVAQTTEQIFTVQTSIPTAFPSRSTGLVDCNCVQEPCTACTSDGFMSIPPGETPLSSASIVSIITDPLLSTVTGIMSIPPGETPISTGSLDKPPSSMASSSRASQQSSSGGSTATNSAPPQQTSNAASPALKDSSPVVLALVGAAIAVL